LLAETEGKNTPRNLPHATPTAAMAGLAGDAQRGGVQPLGDRRPRQRPGEQEALHGVAAHVGEELSDGIGLHTFRDHLHTQRVGQVDDGAHNGDTGNLGLHRHDEGLVNLDLPHREPLQVGQRGVAGAEVVQGQRDTQ